MKFVLETIKKIIPHFCCEELGNAVKNGSFHILRNQLMVNPVDTILKFCPFCASIIDEVEK